MADSDSHNSLIPLILVKFESYSIIDTLMFWTVSVDKFNVFVSIVNSEYKINFIAVKLRRSLLQVK